MHFAVQGVKGFGVPYTKSNSLLVKNHPVMLMAEYARKELLRHPVCLTLVRHKWMMYGRQSFYAIFLFYCLFLISLTSYILTSPNPVTHPNLYNCSAFFNSSTNQTELPGEDFEVFKEISRTIVICFIVIYLLRFLYEGSISILFDVSYNVEFIKPYIVALGPAAS